MKTENNYVSSNVKSGTIPSSAQCSYISVTLRSAAVSGSDVKGMTFEVKPVYKDASGNVVTIANSNLNSFIPFYLPVPANTTYTRALVTHTDDSGNSTVLGSYSVGGDETNGKYIQVSTNTFSSFSYTLMTESEDVVATVTTAAGETSSYTTFNDAMTAANDITSSSTSPTTITLMKNNCESTGFTAAAGHCTVIQTYSNYNNNLTLSGQVTVEGDLVINTGGAIQASSDITSNLDQLFSVTGTLTVTSGTINGNSKVTDVIKTSGTGQLIVSNGTIQGGSTNCLNLTGASTSSVTNKTAISGGTFTGNVTATTLTGFITGGTFSTAPTNYLATGYTAKKNTDNTYTVSLGTVTRSAAVDTYGTICLPYDATYSGVELLKMTAMKDGKILVGSLYEATIRAGEPYFYKATAATQTFTCTGTTYSEAKTYNGLTGTYVSTNQKIGDYYLSGSNFVKATSTTGTVDAYTCYISYSGLTADSYPVESGDMIITASNTESTPIEGNLTGNLIVKLDANAAATIDIYLKNITFQGSSWNSSLVITSAGETSGRNVNLHLIGTCAFISNLNSAIVINPDSYESDSWKQKMINLNFYTLGESQMYVGSNSSSHKVLVDELYNRFYAKAPDYSSGYKSNITFPNAIFDNVYTSVSSGATSESDITWTSHKVERTTSALNTFIESCKSTLQFVQFKMNLSTESRQTSAAWGTFCWPYSGSLTNGDVYELKGKIMNSNDNTIPDHLVLKIKADNASTTEVDERTTFEAGMPYFFHRTGGNEVTFNITGTTYTAAIAADAETNVSKGLLGVYATDYMPVNSYFMVGGVIKKVVTPNKNSVKYNRAYIPNLDTVPVYTVQGAKAAGFLILGEEESATLIKELTSNANAVNSQYYDLTGRRVQTPVKGQLYICNGKKVIF